MSRARVGHRDLCQTTSFARGIRQALAWFEADPARRTIDDDANAKWDRIIHACEAALPTR